MLLHEFYQEALVFTVISSIALLLHVAAFAYFLWRAIKSSEDAVVSCYLTFAVLCFLVGLVVSASAVYVYLERVIAPNLHFSLVRLPADISFDLLGEFKTLMMLKGIFAGVAGLILLVTSFIAMKMALGKLPGGDTSADCILGWLLYWAGGVFFMVGTYYIVKVLVSPHLSYLLLGGRL